MHRPVRYPACALCSFVLLFFVFSERQEDLELNPAWATWGDYVNKQTDTLRWRCSSGMLPYARTNSQKDHARGRGAPPGGAEAPRSQCSS